MGEYPGMEILEIYLRFGSAFFLSLAAVIIGFLLYRKNLSHRIIWKYVGSVVSIYAVWRWVLLLILNDNLDSIYSMLLPWIQPINQMFSILLGITFIVMVLAFRGDTDND